MSNAEVSIEVGNLETKLEEQRLCQKYWIPVLKMFGIDSAIQLQHLDQSSYNKLIEHINFPWEKIALQKLLGLQVKTSSVCQTQSSIKSDEQEEAKKLLQELNKLKIEGRTSKDDLVKEKVKCLCNILHIPQNMWIGNSKEQSLDCAISKLEFCMNQRRKVLEGVQENLDFCEIVKKMSGGILCKGIYTLEHNESSPKICKTLVEPKTVQNKKPAMHVETKTIEFSSKYGLDVFFKSLEEKRWSTSAQLGASVDVKDSKSEENGNEGESESKTSVEVQDSKLKENAKGQSKISAGVGVSKSKENKGGKEFERKSSEVFHSKIILAIVPTAAIEFSASSLWLSEPAIDHLKTIETCIKNSGADHLHSACKQFFNCFGSHVRIGVFHVGGIYQWTSKFSGKTSSTKEDITSLVSDSVSAFAGLCFSGTSVISAGGSISASYVKKEVGLSKVYSDSDVSNTQLEIRTWGGPDGAQSFHSWRAGIESDRSTWTLIDSGQYSSENYIPVWELVRNQRSAFSNYISLANALKQGWEKLTGTTCLDPKWDSQSIEDQQNRIREIVKECNHQANMSKYKSALDEIRKIIGTILETNQNVKPWVSLLREDTSISNFLIDAAKEASDESNTPKSQEIQNCIKNVLSPVPERDFPRKTEIMALMYPANTNIPSNFLVEKNCQSVGEFLSVLQNEFLCQLQQSESSSLISSQVETVYANEHIEPAVLKLRRCLKVDRQYEEVFLLSVLSKLTYREPKFSIVITSQNLSDFLKYSQQHLKDFRRYQDDIKQLQAFLLHLAAESIDKTQDQKKQESMFNAAIRPMEAALIDDIKVLLTKTRKQKSLDFAALSKETLLLLEDQTETVLAIPDLEFTTEGTDSDMEVLVPEEQITFEPEHIISVLGLSHYFPAKIKIHQAMKETGDCTDYRQLPWLIIKTILLNDFRWRDTKAIDVQMQLKEVLDCKPSQNDTDDIFDSDSEEEDSFSGTKDSQTNLIHPLDIFIASFWCSDITLKQTICHKLFMCRQAIPLVYYVPGTVKTSMFSLWPLRGIYAAYKTPKQTSSMFSSTTSCCKMVGFIRVGISTFSKSISTFSKSKFLNDILSTNQTHATFYYQDQEKAQTTRTLCNGLVETAWFLPSGQDSDIFHEVVSFLNLRGNASCHPEHVEVIKRIAQVIVLITDTSSLNDEQTCQTIKDLYKSDTDVMLLITREKQNENHKQIKDSCRSLLQMIEKMTGKRKEDINCIKDFYLKQKKMKTTANLKTEVISKLKSMLKTHRCYTLAERGKMVSEFGLCNLDENEVVCEKGKNLAGCVYSNLTSSKISRNDSSSVAEPFEDLILPRQAKLWKEWSKLQKNCKKSPEVHEHQINLWNSEMETIRQDQIREPVSPGIRTAIQTFFKKHSERAVTASFVTWLKFHLDEKLSETLPTSVGFEHILRELGQTYESVTTSRAMIKEKTLESVRQLPEIAANLLVLGHPVELMDGDAANIPLVWVKAVLSKLEGRLGANKSFVVISILGVQGSGKSTLLNTMFGLRFPVSVGRCTKGVFAQLVPTDTKQTNLPYDYFLVLDTEGLRAPEKHSRDMLDSDSELATLAVGMGDITIINIESESTAEVKDILQIVVHAFLRMKIANGEMELSRRCIFIHQNVSATNAKELMEPGLTKLHTTLNEMTTLAAKEEKIMNLEDFTQIIDFDRKRDVWYFPTLLLGDPPMAPCNPGYSEMVAGVKQRIYEIAEQNITCLPIPDLSQRIQHLWEGILTENFVFGFQNTSEVVAYKRTEAAFQDLMWQFEKHIMDWIVKEVENEIVRPEELPNKCDLQQKLIEKLCKKFIELKESSMTDLEQYFNTNDLKHFTLKWKQAKELQFKEKANDLFDNADKYIQERIEIHFSKFSSQKTILKAGEKVHHTAKELAKQFGSTKPCNSELQSHFEDAWMEVFNQLVKEVPQNTTPIHKKIEVFLYEKMKDQHKLIEQSLKQTPLSESFEKKTEKLQGSLTFADKEVSELAKLTHRIKRQWQKFRAHVPVLKENKDGKIQMLHFIVSATDEIFTSIDTYLKNLLSKDIKYQKEYGNHVLNLLIQGFDNHTNDTFTFLPSYRVQAAVHVCRYLVQKFTEMDKRYEQKYSPAAQMEAYKPIAERIFINTVQEEVEEVLAADLFLEIIKDATIDVVQNGMARKMADEVLKQYKTKYDLIMEIETELAHKESIKLYQSYLSDCSFFALNWLINYIDKLFEKQEGQTVSGYINLSKEHIQIVMTCVRNAVGKIVGNPAEQDICKWCDTFREYVKSTLAISSATISQITRCQIEKLLNFENHLYAKFDDLENRILKVFEQHKPETVAWVGETPYEIVVKKLWGCSAVCPFCHEPCQHTEKDHVEHGIKHRCIQHRPAGLGGVCYDGTAKNDKLRTETCQVMVQDRKLKFRCNACENECKASGKCTAEKAKSVYHKFSEYQKFLPHWDIPPCKDIDSSEYWCWVMNTFKQELMEFHDAKEPIIPTSWKVLDKKGAIQSLRKF